MIEKKIEAIRENFLTIMEKVIEAVRENFLTIILITIIVWIIVFIG